MINIKLPKASINKASSFMNGVTIHLQYDSNDSNKFNLLSADLAIRVLDKQFFYSLYFYIVEQRMQELYERGLQLFEEGKYSEAEVILKDIVSANPQYADILNKLGIISHLKGNLENAAKYFERAIKLNPNYTEASLNLSITYNEMGEFGKAQEVFSMAAQRAHPTPSAIDPFVAGKLANEHYKIGNIYLDFGMNDEAIQEYEKALKLRPALADVHTKLGIALRNKGLIEDAIAHFTKAKEKNPGYGPAWIQLGLSYYIKGLPGLAFEEWEKALENNPGLKEAEAYLRLLKKEEK
ncbi:MAG: tetratricopeptide repeat protein [Nitrospirota bacterium]